MSTPVTRRAVSSGIAWSVPAVAATAAAPAFAASPKDDYFKCPTTYETILKGVTSVAISSSAVQGAYDPSGILKANHMDGTVFGLTFDPSGFVPVPVYGLDGKVKGQTTGGTLLPGCGLTTCAPDVPGGFALPQEGVVVYDGYGAAHKGRVVSAAPSACSPQTNDAPLALTWMIETDVFFNGSACKPDIGPENLISQISIPISLLYRYGLKIVFSYSGASCCLYLNLYLDPTKNNCSFTQYTKGLAYGTGWTISAGLPPAPATPALAPHIDKVKTPAGANTKQYTQKDNVRLIVGGGFTGTTSVTWGGQRALSFTVLSDNMIEVALPTQEMSNGIFRDIVVTNANGSSPTGSTNVAIARYTG